MADEDADDFIQMNDIERSAYYYIRAYEGIPSTDGVVIVDYDEFVHRPEKTFTALIDHYGLKWGDKTRDVLDLVKEPVKDRSFSWLGVEPSLKLQVFSIAEDLKARTLQI